MKKLIFMFMLNTGLLTSGVAQNVEWPRYTKTPTGYLMVYHKMSLSANEYKVVQGI